MPRPMPVIMKLEVAQLLASYAFEGAENKEHWLKHGEAQHYTPEEVENIRREIAAVREQAAAIAKMKG